MKTVKQFTKPQLLTSHTPEQLLDQPLLLQHCSDLHISRAKRPPAHARARETLKKSSRDFRSPAKVKPKYQVQVLQ